MYLCIMKTFKIQAGTYDFTINVCITSDRKKALKFIRFKFENKICFSENDFDAKGKMFYREGWSPVIWLPKIPKTPREHGTVNHEIFHGVYYILSWAGIKLSESSEEAFCHLIGHMTTQFYEKIKKNGHTR